MVPSREQRRLFLASLPELFVREQKMMCHASLSNISRTLLSFVKFYHYQESVCIVIMMNISISWIHCVNHPTRWQRAKFNMPSTIISYFSSSLFNSIWCRNTIQYNLSKIDVIINTVKACLKPSPLESPPCLERPCSNLWKILSTIGFHAIWSCLKGPLLRDIEGGCYSTYEKRGLNMDGG